jgi:hypothetical protein
MDIFKGKNNFRGFYKIWKVNKTTGEKELLVEQDNLVLYSGADLMAQALAGVKNAHISHMYVGYNNVSGSFTPTTLDKANSIGFDNYGSGGYSTFGYLRLPLSYNPTYIAQTNYTNNIVVFTTIISTTDNSHGSTFVDSVAGTPSQIFEIGLAAEINTGNTNSDKLFSRANFSPIIYDANFNLTISWGIEFVA